MTTEARFTAILTAPPERLAQIDRILSGGTEQTPERSFRLYRMGEAVSASGLSRSTLHRCIRDGRIKAVEVRAGSFRIPEAELLRFTQGKDTAPNGKA